MRPGYAYRAGYLAITSADFSPPAAERYAACKASCDASARCVAYSFQARQARARGVVRCYTKTTLDFHAPPRQGLPTFSKGIWKSVSIVQVAARSAAITHVVPQITYAGEYPVAPLADGAHGGFHVGVRVHMWAAAPTAGTISATGEWPGASLSRVVSVAAGNSSVVLRLPRATASSVKLWWPAGHGAQPLYNLSVVFTPSGRGWVAAPVCAQRRVGFRSFALVTGNDTDPAYVAASRGQDGTDTLGMRWPGGPRTWVEGGWGASAFPDRKPPGARHQDCTPLPPRNGVQKTPCLLRRERPPPV